MRLIRRQPGAVGKNPGIKPRDVNKPPKLGSGGLSVLSAAFRRAQYLGVRSV